MANGEVDIAALRLKLKQRDMLTPYEYEFLLKLLPACETRSRGPKVDRDSHETIAMLFALYKASGMTLKAARDKIEEHCGLKRSQIYAICKQHPLKPSIATEFLSGLIKMVERAAGVKSPYNNLSVRDRSAIVALVVLWYFECNKPAAEKLSVRDRSVIVAAAVLWLINQIAEAHTTGWREFFAALPEEWRPIIPTN